MSSMDTMKATIKRVAIALVMVMTIGLYGTINVAAATPSAWALQEIEAAKSINLVTNTLTDNYQNVLTREAFTELLVKTYEALTNEAIDVSTVKNPFTDTKKTFILKAYSVGMANGTTDSLFTPDGPVTREQMTVMYMRMVEQIELTNDIKILDTTLKKVILADRKSVSSWAVDCIDIAISNNILSITSDKKLDPTGYSTGEQALIMNYRLVQTMVTKNLLKTDWMSKLASYKEDTTLEMDANLGAVEVAPVKGVVVADVLNLRSDPSQDSQSNVIKKLKAYEKVTILEEINGWYKVTTTGAVTGYVHKSYVEKYDPNNPVDDVRKQIVAFAKQYIGTPYKYAGNSLTNGIDCSGFTSQVFRPYGYILARSSSGQGSNGKAINESDLLPGDLVLYGYKGSISHTAMYIGDGQIIHATTSQGVRITDMKGYMYKPLIGFRRVIF